MPLSKQSHLLDKSITSHLFKRITDMNKKGLELVNVTEIVQGNYNSDIALVAPKPSGGLNIFLADFLGHDLAIFVVAVPVAEVFHEMTQKGFGISDIVEEINSKLLTILPEGFSCSACFVEMEKKGNMLAVWNGDMPDIVVIDVPSSKITQRVTASGVRLGRSQIKKTDLVTQFVDIDVGNKVFVSSANIGAQLDHSKQIITQSQFEKIVESIHESEHIKQSLTDLIAYQHADFTFIEIEPELIIAKTKANVEKITSSIVPSTNWSVSYQFSAELLRTLDMAPLIVNSVMQIQGMEQHRQRIYTIISELCSNALEHGILKLESKLKATANGFSEYYQLRSNRLAKLTEGFINIELTHHKSDSGGGKLLITVTDSGDGFDYTRHAQNISENKELHGRGEGLLNQLCTDLHYEGKGNIVHVSYEWL